MIIYRTTNLIDGKSYVGKDSKNNPDYLGSGVHLNAAIKKYGKENFRKEIMAWCYEKEHLNTLEKFYIGFCNTKTPNGYNLADGGIGFDIGHKFTEESRRKMSNTRKGMHPSEEFKRKVSEAMKLVASKRPKDYYNNFDRSHKGKYAGEKHWFYGKHHSEETKKKMRESAINSGNTYMKGKHHSEETKKKIGDSQRGKFVSEETRRKIGLVHKGQCHSEETKRKISLANKGKVRSEEMRRKISLILKGRHRTEETKRKISIAHMGQLSSEETRKKLREAWVKRRNKVLGV